MSIEKKKAVLPVKCLLVDDRDENLLALAALLRRDDVQLLQARSGPEALELLLDQPDVALAILDVQMPDMDGFELAELMRGSARTKHIPIVFVTAGSHDQGRQFKGYESGGFDFLHKPISGHVLRAKADVFFELYRQRKQLEDQVSELGAILRLNEMFCAVLGHDLRGPLNVIQLAIGLLRSMSTEPTVQRTVDRIDSNTRTMARMIEDLLDLARARLAGGIPLKRDELDASQVISQIVQERRALSGEVIEFESRGELWGRWDRDRLAQLAGNLIGNAIERGNEARKCALESGQGEIDVRIRVVFNGTNPEHVVLGVKNPGTIASELLPRLFDPFLAGARESGSSGLGLGLYIVHQIVEAHGGRITVDVSNGENTTEFCVTLPREGRELLRF